MVNAPTNEIVNSKEPLEDFFLKNQKSYSLTDEHFSKNDKQLPKFSLVIPTFCRSPHKNVGLNPLYWSLISVIESRLTPEEIIIIDNSSNKKIDHSELVFNEVKKITLSQNKNINFIYKKVSDKGAAKSRNIGIQMAKNELIHLFDDDCIIHPEATYYSLKILSFLEDKYKDIWQKTAMLCLPQNKRSTVPTKLTSIKNMAQISFETFNFTGTISSTFPTEYLKLPQQTILEKPIILENFQGGNIFIFKNKIMNLGGYTEYNSPITYGEETELAIKITKNKLLILYYPFLNLQAVHLSYGNPNSPTELIGNNWLFPKEKLELKELVKLSTVNITETGARTESDIYFYTKIRNFALIINQYSKSDINRWFEYTYTEFVTNNNKTFQDGKTIITDNLVRNKIWQTAKEDFIMNKTHGKAQLKMLFSEKL